VKVKAYLGHESLVHSILRLVVQDERVVVAPPGLLYQLSAAQLLHRPLALALGHQRLDHGPRGEGREALEQCRVSRCTKKGAAGWVKGALCA